jgi:hypothetical protein
MWLYRQVSLLARLSIKRKVEQKHVYPRFSEDAVLPIASEAPNILHDFMQRQTPCPRNSWGLKRRIAHADVRIKPAR